MFCDKFNILSIERVIFVSANEYKSDVTDFAQRSRHKLIVNELIFHIDGESEIAFNDVVLHTHAGTVRFLPQGELKKYVVKRIKRGSCFDIFFTTDIPIAKEAFGKEFGTDGKIAEFFRKIFTVWSNKLDGYYFKCMSLLYELIFTLNGSTYSPQKRLSVLEPALSYIAENYKTERIEIPFLADLCGISETYLKKLFKERYGTSPKRYIMHKRYETAIELVSSGAYSVTAVSEILGFENVYFFSKAFKKEFGLSPTQYVKKCKSSK